MLYQYLIPSIFFENAQLGMEGGLQLKMLQCTDPLEFFAVSCDQVCCSDIRFIMTGQPRPPDWRAAAGAERGKAVFSAGGRRSRVRNCKHGQPGALY